MGCWDAEPLWHFTRSRSEQFLEATPIQNASQRALGLSMCDSNREEELKQHARSCDGAGHRRTRDRKFQEIGQKQVQMVDSPIFLCKARTCKRSCCRASFRADNLAAVIKQ
mmetsp:Transcript_32923/g.80016  ORF Transcript_32923/g.80016 Transcript_32923/m.80016 type:complete len:111 (+) Transcript_32923:172-504(+)